MTEAPPALETHVRSTVGEGLAVAVWTTTPWTLPANLAVAVSETIEYAVVEHASLGARYPWAGGWLLASCAIGILWCSSIS